MDDKKKINRSDIINVVSAVVVAVLVVASWFFPIEIVDDVETKAVERGSLLCATESGNCVESWNGSDVALYSDGGSSETLRLDGGQGNVVMAMPTDIATATPGFLINNSGGLANPLEIRKNSTPVFYVDADGNATYSGFSSAGGLTSAAAGVAAPTAVGTATPAFFADSSGVSNLFEVRDAGTPVVQVNNGGAVVSTGAGTHAGGQTVNNWIKAAAPTAIATATPAMVVDSLGVSNILEVRDAATPVFTVNNGGAVVAANGQTISAGGLTVTAGGLTVTAGDVAMTDGWVNIGAQTAISVTAGAVITPTGTFQVLESGAAVTCNTSLCIEDGTTAGDLLILRNSNASDTITIDGTGGNVECKSDVVLGAEDTLWLMWNGSDWVCLSGYDNS